MISRRKRRIYSVLRRSCTVHLKWQTCTRACWLGLQVGALLFCRFCSQCLPAADMWALGCLLYTLCYGVHPFANATQLQIVNANVRYPATVPGGQPVNPLALVIMQALLQQQVFGILRSSINRLSHARSFFSRQPLLRPTAQQLKAAIEHAVAGGAVATLPPLAPPPRPSSSSSPAASNISTSLPRLPPSPSSEALLSPQPREIVITDATPVSPSRELCEPAPLPQWAHFDNEEDLPPPLPLLRDGEQQQAASSSFLPKSAVAAAGVVIPTGTERDSCAHPTCAPPYNSTSRDLQVVCECQSALSPKQKERRCGRSSHCSTPRGSR